MDLIEIGGYGYIRHSWQLIKASVGDRKTVNGKTYALNQSHRWELEDSDSSSTQLSLFGLPVLGENVASTVEDSQQKQATKYTTGQVNKYLDRFWDGKPTPQEIQEWGLRSEHPGIAWDEAEYQTWMDLYRDGEPGFGDRLKVFFLSELNEGGIDPGNAFYSTWKKPLQMVQAENAQRVVGDLLQGKKPQVVADSPTQIVVEFLDRRIGLLLEEERDEGKKPYTLKQYEQLSGPDLISFIRKDIASSVDHDFTGKTLKDLAAYQINQGDWEKIGEEFIKKVRLDASYQFEKETGKSGFGVSSSKPFQTWTERTSGRLGQMIRYMARVSSKNRFESSLEYVLSGNPDYQEVILRNPSLEQTLRDLFNTEQVQHR